MKYTNEIFQRLSQGQFISSNSVEPDTRALYDDIYANQQQYEEYFKQIDFQLSAGDGYFYFSRNEAKVIVENKLQALFSWIDYVDFLKTYDTSFGAGTQFSLAQIEIQLAVNIELKEKLSRLFSDKQSNREKIDALVESLKNKGFAELINEREGLYQVTSAFHYIEQIILCININDDIKDEIPE